MKVNFKLQKCVAYQDLPTLQFWSKSQYPFWSYFPCIREIWRFAHPRKVIFPKGNNVCIDLQNCRYSIYLDASEIWLDKRGLTVMLSPLIQIIVTIVTWYCWLLSLCLCQRFGEFCQMKSFGHLCLQNYYFGTSLELIPLYDQSVKSWEFRIREIRCFDKCHVGLFRPIEFLYK
jgi:hypothetical protein